MAGGAAQQLAGYEQTGLPEPVGIIGATSFVGSSLLAALSKSGRQAVAFTRKDPPASTPLVTWVQLDQACVISTVIKRWVVVVPIWASPAYFSLIKQLGAESLVVLSSTSVITKCKSIEPNEQATIKRMLDAEAKVQAWATNAGIHWAILRPTLIYGRARDKNLSEIARIIRKTRLFPLLGPASGQRQPVHVDDVASACLAALERPASSQSIYTLSGAEILPYHEMVKRVFIALGIKPIFVRIPSSVFEWAVKGLKLLPRYRSWTPSMAERMNLDMAFSHEDATRDFGFTPRGFNLSRSDLP